MFRRNMMLGLLLMLPLFLCNIGLAQKFSVLPGVHVLPNDLTAYLQFMKRQRLDSLRLFSDYLEQRAAEKQVPRGLYLNAKAMQLQAELEATQDPAAKKELLTMMTKLYEQRVQLDARTPNKTWYGVDRVKLGDYMKNEFQRFEQQAAQRNNAPPKTPPQE